MEKQDLSGGEGEVEIWSLRYHANHSLDLDLLGPYVIVTDPRLPARRPDARCKNADCGGLSGAVWSKYSEDLARQHFERQSVEREDLACRLVLLAPWAKSTARSKRRRRRKDFA